MIALVWLAAAVAASPWSEPAPGLEVARLEAPVRSEVGDSRVTVVRIDPERYEFRLLSSKLLKLEANLTAKEWVERHGVWGAINASMYRTDHRQSVAFMKDGAGVNNDQWTKDNAVFAAAPDKADLPPVQILDRVCDDVETLKPRYAILIQNIRMLDCEGANTWARQPRKWSAAAVGTDRRGRVLFIHSRSPYSMHDFIEVLQALSLDLKRLMYVEGGPEASLYVAVDDKELVSQFGSFETGFREMDDNRDFWPIPNVIAFAPKKPAH
jgi:uncharacterized protein YigE (DUF2233 family)